MREALTENAAKQDVIITTAQIPGRPAPLLITAEAVAGMQPGSVIVDMAADSGGNVEPSKPGETVVENDVKVIGPTNLPSEMATHASQLYAKNVENLLGLLVDEEGNLNIDFDDHVFPFSRRLEQRSFACRGVSARRPPPYRNRSAPKRPFTL